MLMLRNAKDLGIHLSRVALKDSIRLITQKAIMSICIMMERTVQ